MLYKAQMYEFKKYFKVSYQHYHLANQYSQ